jgi:hypothetical protein
MSCKARVAFSSASDFSLNAVVVTMRVPAALANVSMNAQWRSRPA